ncbi:hypothetical protein F4814DRAFT_456923 [Daldinia grandis]|nr:hypothetical protein F4814DRAFT_456923 [Daldinia grandis]
MDPTALSPELREKIQWAGNGVLTYRDARTHMANPPPAQHGYGAPPANYHQYGNGPWARNPGNSDVKSQYPPSASYYPPSEAPSQGPWGAYQESTYEAESEAEPEQDTVPDLSQANTSRSRSHVGGSSSRGQSQGRNRLSDQISALTGPGGPPSYSSWRPPFASQFGSDQGSAISSRAATPSPLTRANLSAVSDASQRVYVTPSRLHNMSPAHSPSAGPRSDARQYRDQASSPGPRTQSHRGSTATMDLDSVDGGAPLWSARSRRSGA